MKKFLIAFFVAIYFTLMSITVFAEKGIIDRSRMAIGGIQLGSTMNYVRSIHGNPDKIVKNKMFPGGIYNYTWYYGDSFEMLLSEVSVTYITLTNKSRFTTPDGITVGSNGNLVRKIYGEPWPIYSSSTGDKAYLVYVTHDVNSRNFMSFIIENGVVTKIAISYE